MSHDILDDNKVAVVGEAPWHGLGKVYTSDISATDAYNEMGGFTLYKKAVGVMFDDKFVNIPNNFAIVRGPVQNGDQNHVVFGYATDHYHIIQPEQIINGFDNKVKVSIETLGFISGGRKMFLTWKLPSCFVKETDEVQLYGTVLFGFDKVFSSRFNVGTIRVVCNNTFQMALNEETNENKAKRGRGTIYSGKHSDKNLLPSLLAWMEFIQENSMKQSNLVNSLFNKFAETPIIHEKQALHLIEKAFPNPAPLPEFMPESLKQKKQEQIDTEIELKTKIRDGIYDVFTGSEGIAIDESYWGLFNACTQFFNYKLPAKKDTAFSILWGNRNNQMNSFANVLLQDINSK